MLREHDPPPPPGWRPGTLAVERDAPKPRIHVVSYSRGELIERSMEAPEEIGRLLSPERVTWIDVQGLGDEKILREIAGMFSLHPLVMEDVASIPERPKAEWHDENVFVITRFPARKERSRVELEQISIFIGQHYVLTFQESYQNHLQPVWDRICRVRGPILREGADYLGYAIVDHIIDSYYPVLEELGDYLEDLETEAMSAASEEVLLKSSRIRGNLLELRRVIWPLREAVNVLLRNENELLTKSVQMHLRDIYDHCLQISEVLESYRELAAAISSTYLSAVSNRTNEVMKVLTIMASIFIPLTFIAGVYGMNFEYMPELGWRWAYPAVLAVMVVAGLGMVLYFRHKGWLGGEKAPPSGWGKKG